MSPAEHGARLAADAPDLTPEQVEQAARCLATVQAEGVAA